MRTRCHNAAAATARRGNLRSIHASLKKLAVRNFRDSTGRLSAAETLLEKLCRNSPQLTSSCGSPRPGKWTVGGAALPWPSRSKALAVCVVDMKLRLYRAQAGRQRGEKRINGFGWREGIRPKPFFFFWGLGDKKSKTHHPLFFPP